ncbi:hypothetical protein THAOC_13032 [Thalassiosira oceanica]|uniref:Uncharacterized protein n=1 Tax=Thalassiosira oceanica TaxID=159749 RepID=K0T6K2_THAOC|nr:hypothetical protein THAOC_13032 [Thalassiosira oceanica]|mmetsp:Transcript_27964/g.63608  ORF Transcript_27964/g.63608 Transcript_27964/m.63608 type:complete len:271 (-) Transcript_27964:239-1051(-)|eukprot:EJK66067.1 hypothetical protein THAOC_13032 [Thalassiosira oceanica]
MIRASRVLLKSSGDAKKAAGEYAFRAVGRGESAKPTATAAPEETMMPWNGWFSSFLKDKLGDEKYEKLRETILYRPNDYTGFEQMPRPNTKLHISDEDPTLTHQFRQPSPGSQPPVRQPSEDASFGNAGDDPYDVTYYKRDTGRRYTSDPTDLHRDLERIKLELLPQDDPRVKEAMEEFEKGPGSAPGNKGVFATGKTDYDPSGLRAAMSTSFEATEASLDANMPDHLPTPTWMSKQQEIVDWYEERDLPVAIGGTGFGLIPTHARVARW